MTLTFLNRSWMSLLTEMSSGSDASYASGVINIVNGGIVEGSCNPIQPPYQYISLHHQVQGCRWKGLGWEWTEKVKNNHNTVGTYCSDIQKQIYRMLGTGAYSAPNGDTMISSVPWCINHYETHHSHQQHKKTNQWWKTHNNNQWGLHTNYMIPK